MSIDVVHNQIHFSHIRIRVKHTLEAPALVQFSHSYTAMFNSTIWSSSTGAFAFDALW